MTPRRCERCGHGFWSRSLRHRFCSDACRAKAVQGASPKEADGPAALLDRAPNPRTEYILAEWDKGRSLAQIAVELGISRARAADLAGGVTGKARAFVPIAVAARQVGVNEERVRAWIGSGVVERGANGTVAIADVRGAYEGLIAPRRCRTCGGFFSSRDPHRVHCSKHVPSAGAKIRYEEWSARRRRNHSKLVDRWKREHPELAAATQKRASLVYRLVTKGTPRERARQIARAKYPDPLPTEAVAR